MSSSLTHRSWTATAFALLCGGCALRRDSPGAEDVARARGVRVDYHVRYVPEPDAARWDVTMAASGLDPAAGPITFQLGDWGEWMELDSVLLRSVRGEPAVRRDANNPTLLWLEPPPGWTGSAELCYSIALTRRGSRAEQRVGLWPWQGDGFAHGFTSNTLACVQQNGAELEAALSVEFTAPAGTTLNTGWTGMASTPARATLAHALDNTAVFFGEPSGWTATRAALNGREVRVEVAQYGGERDCSAAAERAVRALVAAYEDSTGLTYDEPLRVFLLDSGGGGVCVDHALVVGFDSHSNGPELNEDTRHTLAHELFHHWLGNERLKPADDVVWFYEGFTDYIAVRTLAATDLYTPAEFCARLQLLDHLAASSPARGTVAFGDATIAWRDGDGPNETLAYRGGALLAFLADVELRARGHAGIDAIVGDLARSTGGRFHLADVRAWFDAQGLSEFAAAHIDRPSPLALDDAWLALGVEAVELPTDVAYVGLSGSGEPPFVTVESVDPAGPAARAGIRSGDRVTGLWPSRSALTLASELPEPYASHRYGLDFIQPGKDGTYVNVKRDGVEVHCPIEPVSVPLGLQRGYRVAERERYEAFLRRAPR